MPELTTVGIEKGLPASFVWRSQKFTIQTIIDSWRIEGRWWADGTNRIYYRVECQGGALIDLYQNTKDDNWFVDRLWD